MATIEIRKKSASVWTHTPSDFEKFIQSRFRCKVVGDYFRVVEFGGRQLAEYHFSDVTVYDDTQGGGAETFSSGEELMLRLESLEYPAFTQGSGGGGIGFQPVVVNPQNGQTLIYSDGQWINGFLDLNGNRFITVQEIPPIVNGEITLPEGFVWVINTNTYFNANDEVFEIEEATAGFYRTDIIVAQASETQPFVYIQGVESEDTAVPPTVPDNTLLVTSISVFGDQIGTPTSPIDGSEFIKKQSEQWANYTLTGLGGLPILPQINENNRNINITGNPSGLSSLGGFVASGGASIANFWDGMTAKVLNSSPNNQTIKHNYSGADIKYLFPNEEDYIIRPNEVVYFDLKGGNLVFRYSTFLNAKDVFFDNTGTDLDSEEVEGAIKEINDKVKLPFPLFTSIRKTSDTPLIEASESGWDNRLRENGNIIWDGQQYVMCYSGYIPPYSETGAVYIGIATSPTGEPGTWTKRGINGDGKAFDFNYGEDPYLIFKDGEYIVYYENKSIVPQTIAIASTTDLDGEWTNVTDEVLGLLPGEVDDMDVSSPTLFYENEVLYIFYEYRKLTTTQTLDSRGTTYLAKSLDFGNNWEIIKEVVNSSNLTWSTSSIPDDVFKYGSYYFLLGHGELSQIYRPFFMFSNNLEDWSDFLQKPFDVDNESQTARGGGIMVYINNNGTFKAIYGSNTQRFEGVFNSSLMDSWVYRESLASNVEYARLIRGVINANRNEYIVFTQTAERDYTPIRPDDNGGAGINKIIRNNSNFNFKLKPIGGVVVDGSDIEIILSPQEYIHILSTGKNTYTLVSRGVRTPALVSYTNSYNDLDDKPDLSNFVESSELSEVAFSGSYDDLDDKPAPQDLDSVLGQGDVTDKEAKFIDSDSTNYSYINGNRFISGDIEKGSYTKIDYEGIEHVPHVGRGRHNVKFTEDIDDGEFEHAFPAKSGTVAHVGDFFPDIHFVDNSDDNTNLTTTSNVVILTSTNTSVTVINLPPLTDGLIIYVTNKGSADLKLISIDSTNDFWENGVVSPGIDVEPGTTLKLVCDGVHYILFQ